MHFVIVRSDMAGVAFGLRPDGCIDGVLLDSFGQRGSAVITCLTHERWIALFAEGSRVASIIRSLPTAHAGKSSTFKEGSMVCPRGGAMCGHSTSMPPRSRLVDFSASCRAIKRKTTGER